MFVFMVNGYVRGSGHKVNRDISQALCSICFYRYIFVSLQASQ